MVISPWYPHEQSQKVLFRASARLEAWRHRMDSSLSRWQTLNPAFVKVDRFVTIVPQIATGGHHTVVWVESGYGATPRVDLRGHIDQENHGKSIEFLWVSVICFFLSNWFMLVFGTWPIPSPCEPLEVNPDDRKPMALNVPANKSMGGCARFILHTNSGILGRPYYLASSIMGWIPIN